MNNPPPRMILVTGDPICEHNYYRGNRPTADSAEKRGFRVYQAPGGALMLKHLIKTMIETANPTLKHWRTEFGLTLDFKKLPNNYNAYCLWEPQVSNPTEKDAGLGASRELRRLGHGLVKTPVPDNPEKYEDNPNPGFPFQEIATRIDKPSDKFVSSPLPAEITNRGKWMMLDAWQGHAQASELIRPHYEAALAVAVLGPDGLERFPVARFGKLLTVDRSEIESLRTLRQLISSYQAAGVQKKPLSIGVFGPPGAGKSFGVTEISKAVLGEQVEPLTFNLSQFSDPTDLVGAFHQVRDRVLTGETPVVFWDEFDSQDYRWLQFSMFSVLIRDRFAI